MVTSLDGYKTEVDGKRDLLSTLTTFSTLSVLNFLNVLNALNVKRQLSQPS
jgi:hypothetical protein